MQYGTQTSFDGAAALGAMLLAGAAMGVFYDVFRVLRRFFRFGYSMVFAQDILFFVVSAVFVFFSGTTLSGGRMRVSFVLAALTGWLLYSLTAGAAVMFAADKLVSLLGTIAGGARRLIDAHILKPEQSGKKNNTD